MSSPAGTGVTIPTSVLDRRYAPPRDALLLTTNEARVLEIADRLWESRDSVLETSAIAVAFDVEDGPAPEPLAERRIAWTLGEDVYDVAIDGLLSARIDLSGRRVRGCVSRALLSSDPALFARIGLECTVGVLLQRRAWLVLHAGAVAGSRGAVVLRGGSGAGKSTLVGAAHAAGLTVLADESLLVAREDHDDLASSVRDLTLLRDSVTLLGLDGTQRAYTGGEEKCRVDLFEGSSPADRRARRAATFLLGPRTPGPARLVALSPEEFLNEFRKGSISQERVTADPEDVALDWRAGNGFRLDGASDLAGAVELLQMYAGRPNEFRNRRAEAAG